MLSLGKTLTRLARQRRQWERLWKQVPPVHRGGEPPASRLAEVTGFGSNPGALRMFTHVPRHPAPSPALVVVLHGCTQSAASYDYGAGWSTLADRYGFFLLFPEQQPANNPKKCFNWFLPGDTERGRGEPLSIRQMIERMIADHRIDPTRIFVTGLSAGGAMTAVMLATYPEAFSAGAIIAGLPYRTATNVQQAYESMFNGNARPAREWGDLVRQASPHRGPWPRVSVWHGDADATVQPVNADEIVKQWTDVHEIDAAPAATEMVDGYPRQVWCNAGGEILVESYTITSMAHGTPLAIGDDDAQCGATGAFLLDVGISSSYHIAKFFGLTGEKRAAARPRAAPSLAPAVPSDGEQEPSREAEAAPAAARGSLPIDIQAVITRALKAAGLVKSEP